MKMTTTENPEEPVLTDALPKSVPAAGPVKDTEALDTVDLNDDNDKPAESNNDDNVESKPETAPAPPTLVIHDTTEETTTDAVAAESSTSPSTNENSAATSTSALSHKPSVSSVNAAIDDNEEDESSLTVSKPRRSKRSHSFALSVSNISTTGQQTVSSIILFKSAFELISKHKAVSKNPTLQSSVNRALTVLQRSELPPPNVIYEPLRLVCSQTNVNELKVLALDCIGKLFSFSYLEDPEVPEIDPQSGITPPPQIPIMDRAIKTVCDCFTGEGTDAKVELQIIKALMAAVLNDDLIAHGATLLKAIRQTYTIFVVSNSVPNQNVAEATLSQMVNVIFDRLKPLIKRRPGSLSGPSLDSSVQFSAPDVVDSNSSEKADTGVEQKLTLSQMESLGSSEVERVKEDLPNLDEEESDLFAKDAFLIFRALCKLSEKPLESDGLDYRSSNMRSKLLSLHLIHTILKSHMTVFLSNDIVIRSQVKGDEPFLVSIKDYICATLARNAASISPPVFEISAEIFWLILSNLRSQFKKEIEVFFAEIYFPIAEMKTSTSHQKQYFLSIIQKLSNDPRGLVEIYLNYDCDSSSAINIYESTIDYLVRYAVSPVHLTAFQLQQYTETKNKPIAVYNLSLPPAMAISNLSLSHNAEPQFPIEYSLKMTGLQSLVAVLSSLLAWSQRGIAAVSDSINKNNGTRDSIAEGATSDDTSETATLQSNSTNASKILTDDPSQFQSLKIKKTAFLDAIRQFNTKPKYGIKAFLNAGILEHDTPEDIAKLLLNTEGLDKSQIGEYLGEGDPEHIAIMHAFVDLMDFSNKSFVDAMRVFLQAFRLPGEAQKIDRYMLKFAERYISDNPSVFANADTAYVLAYSVILLNTDLHSPQVKNRMTFDDFLRNNRGINDGSDLPAEYLQEIYNTIRDDEIKLLSEQHAALLSSGGQQAPSGFAGISQALATVGRDLQREAYMQASRQMSYKTEQLFKSLVSKSDGKKRSTETIFYIASHIEHVKPMFEVGWMSFLAGLSGPFQETEDSETVKLCLEGFKFSIRIACLFDVDLARISFISALSQFTNLQKLGEMKQKNVYAIKQLLATALSEGNNLKSSWKEILTCISQLERFQLISSGIEAGAIPDVTNARLASHRDSIDTQHQSRASTSGSLFSGFGLSSVSTATSHNDKPVAYDVGLGEELQSREVVITMDKIFSKSASLSGEAIVDFVRALTEVSWEEIQSSGLSEHPRTFSLQKMVDVCYYNMERIRFEWSQLWAIMGKSFNQVGCHENTNVAFFALDSLRQLSIRFFDLEELSHFKFQKDFLEPFEYVMEHNKNTQAKDMVIQCLQQMILAKSERIKSGWRTMFATFSVAAKQPYSTIVNETFDLVKKIHTSHLEQIIAQESFGSLVSCLSEIGKNQHFQKPSLHALDLLKQTIQRILVLTEKQKAATAASGEASDEDEPYNKYWFPVLSAFHDVIMNGEDLEVRSRALNYMFDTLTEYGSQFSANFWDTVCRQLLFPIFVVLKSRSEMARFNTQDDMSVWLSTTMIQALRNMIALLSHYFEILSRMLDGFLDLLVTCIIQENETVSRIGSSCILQLVEQNVDKFSPTHWTQVVDKIEFLFKSTTASELFSALFASDEEEHDEKDLGATAKNSTHEELEQSGRKNISAEANHRRQKVFRKTIMKCVLQLLMVDTMRELLERQETIEGNGETVQNGSALATSAPTVRVIGSEIYDKIPVKELLRICDLLRHSYIFSREFNDDRDLRTTLWRQGFMKQLPNLLKQESISAQVYISVMLRLYNDKRKLQIADGDEGFEAVVDEDANGIVGGVASVLGADGKVNQREAFIVSIKESDERTKATLKTTEELKLHVEKSLWPVCLEVLSRYNQIDPSETRNFKAWNPVVVSILDGIAEFPKGDFTRVISVVYPAVIDILGRDMTPQLRLAVQKVFSKVNDYVLKGKGMSRMN
ncbi:similar to Saccharomyces cerevisiae YDR170C SEC7 Guanine nucleotide exchange factor (GEF) for ADP ribosylation factors involved in proliferation of the Golgi, intra-Golgi and ER-to-Golgi transport [Geotrichum candidum]|uniref:Similar to Saccharomyces cerevisiae YDR170C SEC7 Guanine nucleotide exchange factor (GEF) for ADP ribosylation factors involved in proliferation of the Golgi, intra-Golgi and ER-to-Golgi transport n=1 Tax=Geotrichum candidum TaxID=1173061 RepID=A0A0J9X8V4_GEOCN|nr:similar to Saccharomyces cerevisiae YDR170C SEC7 Guanine nucleotide exchange factor (GEF) for ADP ribosylation factors involved in proliferation of the Golgi, intra-Golgi and ER-to-Golgi transport [Geotrichum candidum]